MITASQYIQRIIRAWAARIWWVALVPLAVIAWGLAADWRIAVIGFMLLLIVYPMAATFAVLSCATRPDVARRTRASRAVFDDSLDRVELILDTLDDDGAVIASDVLESAVILGVQADGDTITLRIGPAIPDFILLPRHAIEPDRLAALLARHAPAPVDL